MLTRALKYVWTAPTTAVGMAVIPLALVSRGNLRVVDGVLEVSGPAVRWLLLHLIPLKGGASAMALGHVVLGVDHSALERTREHERVHVRQAEQWGVLFIPAYLLAGVWQWLHRRDAYLDNPFERAARGEPE